DLADVREASERVAQNLLPGRLVVLESTTYPGTTEEIVRPILEASGLEAGKDFALAYSPERIDPGNPRGLQDTPKVVAGAGSLDAELASAFYSSFVSEVLITTSIRHAQISTLIAHTFRPVNTALANALAILPP